MEGSKFKKLCTDCGLLDKKFTVTDVDLIFVKVHDIAHSFTKNVSAKHNIYFCCSQRPKAPKS